METMDELFDGSNAHELGGDATEPPLVTAEDLLPAAGGSPAPTLIDAMYLLAKLRDEKYYPKGGYSSDMKAEWDAMLDSWFGGVRPCF